MIRANQGLDDGTLRKSDALEQRLLDQICQLRGTYATIGDKLSCRMPLPYTHFVQVLVDTFIALSPFALYADLGIYSIIGCGKCVTRIDAIQRYSPIEEAIISFGFLT